jgi:hypothetical protein
MTGLIHPGSRVDAVPAPPVDGYEPEPPRASPRTVDECDGPGPLIREYRWSPHTIANELVEDCPTCAGTLQHRYRRVIRLEDQDETAEWVA